MSFVLTINLYTAESFESFATRTTRASPFKFAFGTKRSVSEIPNSVLAFKRESDPAMRFEIFEEIFSASPSLSKKIFERSSVSVSDSASSVESIFPSAFFDLYGSKSSGGYVTQESPIIRVASVNVFVTP